MAIDSEDKRRSVTGVIGNFTIKPIADGTVGTADRAHAACFYSGLTYAAPPGGSAIPVFQYYHNQTRT
jgi:hypothetical protein